jgi:hypothetical protein
MSQAYLILRRFAQRIAQVHLSEVNVQGRHSKLTISSTFAYPRVLPLIPPEVPVILESPVTPGKIGDELKFAADIWAQRGQHIRMTAL